MPSTQWSAAGTREERFVASQEPLVASSKGSSMFRRLAGLPTRTKLVAILVSLLIPVVMLTYFDVSKAVSTISIARGEDRGNQWVKPLVVIAREIGEHRDHAAGVAAGSEQERAGMQESQGIIEQSVKVLDDLDHGDVGGFSKVVGWSALRGDVTKVISAEVNTPRLFQAHDDVLNHVLEAVDSVAGKSGLALDPEAASFSLIDASILQMPRGLNALELARRHFDAINAGDTSLSRHADLGEQLGLARVGLDSVFNDLTDDYAEAVPADKATVAAAESARQQFHEIAPKLRALNEGGRLSADDVSAVSKRTGQLVAALGDMQDAGVGILDGILKARVHSVEWELYTHIAIVLIALALALVIVLAVSRYLGSQVSKANSIFANMANGRLDNEVGEQPGDELGMLLAALDGMQAKLRGDIEAERRASKVNARMKQSLDATSSNVMVADADNNIIYTNVAASQLMKNAQAEIRREVPGFDAGKLIGSSIDVFHKNPAHQRDLLAGLTGTHTTEVKMGGLTIRIIASPIIDEQGERLGTVVEWVDRTQEAAVEDEVQTIVAEALNGNLDGRVAEEGKTGFFRMLSGGLNELVANVEAVVNEVQTLVSAVNDGNLDRRIRVEGKSGLMVKLGSGINNLTNNIATVVDQVQNLVNAANDGDLKSRIQTEGQSGLLVKVGTGINELTDGMARIVSQVKVAAGEVNRGAEEISQGNAHLSQRTEEQASSLEETASSMEQMTSTVKQNAENAGEANQLALAARDQAEKGGAVVARAVKAMSEINEASGKIANIIGVIDEIAFQTNLLALNAAVEAARAGEQGRGFAVVATEVRNLAGRSATAAKEIKALIHDSVSKVEEGSTLVTQSGATLEQIVGAVKKVTDIVAEIAAASQEQSAGIEQVNKAVMQLDELTQQNAALVEEASAASQSMAEQARGLNESMARYRVDDSQLADMLLSRLANVSPAVKPAARHAAVRGKPVRNVNKPAAGAAHAAAVEATGLDDAVWKEF